GQVRGSVEAGSPAQVLQGHGRNVMQSVVGSRLLSPAGGSSLSLAAGSKWIRPPEAETRQHGRHLPLRITPATAPASSRARARAAVRGRAGRTSARRTQRPALSSSGVTAGWPATATE